MITSQDIQDFSQPVSDEISSIPEIVFIVVVVFAQR